MDPYRYQAMRSKAYEMLKLPGPYDSTYKSSYTDMPTYQVSPLYDDDRKLRAERERSPRRGYDDRDEPPRSHRESYDRYVPRSYREPNSYRDPSPSRDRDTYRRDPSPVRDYYQRDQSPYRDNRIHQDNRDREGSYRNRDGSYRDRNGFYRRSPTEVNPRDYQDQLVDNKDIPDEEKRLIFCQNCFASKQVMTQLGCRHHYCNNCMNKLNASDMFTRAGETNLHHQCNICNSWTSCKRLVRLDPFGRRLLYV